MTTDRRNGETLCVDFVEMMSTTNPSTHVYMFLSKRVDVFEHKQLIQCVVLFLAIKFVELLAPINLKPLEKNFTNTIYINLTVTNNKLFLSTDFKLHAQNDSI